MTRSLLYATLAAGLACAVQAQQPNEPAHKTMLLTGCLQSVPDQPIFKLSEATLQAPAAGIPGSPQPGPVGTAGKGSAYELTTDTGVDRSGAEPVDLKKYAGRRVQVTARPPETAPSSPTNSAASSTNVERDSKADEQTPPRLIVTAIKQLASSCQ